MQSSEKKKTTETIIPTKENYGILLSHKYTVKQLKEIATHHKIKLGGASVKADIISKIYNYFKLYDSALVIQKTWRKYLFRQYNNIRGPARFKRSLCVNETDFFTMDNIVDIPYNQFFSFKDSDNMVYGFDIMSVYNLFDKTNAKVTNPYNRNPFPRSVKKNMLKIIWLSKLFKDKLTLTMTDENDTANNENNANESNSSERNIVYRITELFHDIDLLGNYTNANWFLSLNQSQLVKYIYELNDIWSYRADLSENVKRDICPEYTELFRMLDRINLRAASFIFVLEACLNIMEKLVKNGVNRPSRCLGANYVLCALTLVSTDAAEALPWLYQSVI
jgi:hypothetical protein